MKQKRHISWQEVEEKCQIISKMIKKNKQIKNIYGVSRGGLIPAIMISYLTKLPLYPQPTLNSAVIDDVYETGKTRQLYKNNYFFVLIDKQLEKEKRYVQYPWEKYIK